MTCEGATPLQGGFVVIFCAAFLSFFLSFPRRSFAVRVIHRSRKIPKPLARCSQPDCRAVHTPQQEKRRVVMRAFFKLRDVRNRTPVVQAKHVVLCDAALLAMLACCPGSVQFEEFQSHAYTKILLNCMNPFCSPPACLPCLACLFCPCAPPPHRPTPHCFLYGVVCL